MAFRYKHIVWDLLFIMTFFTVGLKGQSVSIDSLKVLLSDKAYELVIEEGGRHLATEQLSRKDSAEVLHMISLAQQYAAQVEASNETTKKAWDLILSCPETDETIPLKVDIANTYLYHLGAAFEYKKSLELARDILETLHEYDSHDAERRIKIYFRMVAVFRVTAVTDSAFFYLEKIKGLIDEVDESKRDELTIRVLSEEAGSHGDAHQLRKAISIYKSILEIAEATDNFDQITVFHNNIAVAYYRMGDYGKSEYHLLKSLEHKRKKYDDWSPSLITNYSNLATINVALERYEEADEYNFKLRDIIDKEFGEDHPRHMYTYRGLGDSHYSRQLYEAAIDYYKKSLAVMHIHLDEPHDEIATTSKSIGACYMKLNQYEAGLEYLNTAIKNWKDLDRTTHIHLGEAYTILAEYYLDVGNIEAFENKLQEAFNSINYDLSTPYEFEKIELPSVLIGMLRLKMRYETSAQYTTDQERREQGVEYLLPIADSLSQFLKYRFDDIRTRRKLSSQMKWRHEYRILHNMSTGNEAQALESSFLAMERSNNMFLYEKRIADEASEWMGLPISWIDRKKMLQDSLAYYSQLLANLDRVEDSRKYDHALEGYNQMQDSLNKLLDAIRSDFPEYYNMVYSPTKIDLPSVQKQLDEETLAISYFLGEDHAFVLTIDNKESKLYKLEDPVRIRRTTGRLNEELVNKSNLNVLDSLCENLGKLLLEEVLTDDKSKLIIMPDDVLGFLPFEILKYKGRYLLENFSVRYHYSHSIHQKGNSRKVREQLLMAPVFDYQKRGMPNGTIDNDRSQLTYLPESEQEVLDVSNIFKSQVFLFEDATEERFKTMAPVADIIHLATHGVIDAERPDQSRLYFYDREAQEDGVLYSSEIVNLRLEAELIVLSACNTGAGKLQTGEGIGSLGRAFAYAGINNQVISLWQVNDSSTREIMVLFYENLKKGMGKGEALTAAKKEFLKTSPAVFQHPYYWAGLVYYGDDEPVKRWVDYAYLWLLLLAALIFGLTYFLRSKYV